MRAPFAFLLHPGPDDRSFAALLRKVRLLGLRALLGAPPPPGMAPAQAASLRRVQVLLPELARRHPEALFAALGAVDVLTPLLLLEGGRHEPGPLLEAAVPALLVGLCRRGALPEAVVWEGPLSTLVDGVGGRVLHLSTPASALLCDAAGVELRLADGRRLAPEHPELQASQPFLPLRPGISLSLFDSNPLASVEDHPDKQGNRLDLGGRSTEEWAAALDQALGLIERGLPAWAAELPLALQRLLPVGFEPERHLSASYREAPGLAYLTLHPDPLTLAEAIVHETQHSKLNVLSLLDAVLENGRTTWTASPVRPDLRPLMGVLLAVHAFVPVAALHAGLEEAGHPLAETAAFQRRRAAVLASNARGLQIVEELGRPTAAGARLLREARALHDALAGPDGAAGDQLPGC
jgi:HEXXH motif-containing protein